MLHLLLLVPLTLPLAAAQSCGVSPYPNFTGRIVGGREAVPGEFPWQLSLELDHPEEGVITNHCGGVLIDKQWLLTAAHCVVSRTLVLSNPRYWKVRVGAHNLKTVDASEKKIGVSMVYYHPWFQPGHNDIALMKLDEPVPTNANIMPICLPTKTDTFEGMTCTASGWGRVSFSSKKGSDELKAVEVQVFENSKCNVHGTPILTWHLCAGNLEEGKGACMGDSGGPLACKTRDRGWVLAGLTSLGSPICGERGFPDVYTRVSHFLSWIKQVRGY